LVRDGKKRISQGTSPGSESKGQAERGVDLGT